MVDDKDKTRSMLSHSEDDKCSNEGSELAIKFGFRMLRYLKGTDQHGLKYHSLKATKKKFQEFKEDWPDEAFDEMKICVWSDSSFASQVHQKSQGALVVTQAGSPVFGSAEGKH